MARALALARPVAARASRVPRTSAWRPSLPGPGSRSAGPVGTLAPEAWRLRASLGPHRTSTLTETLAGLVAVKLPAASSSGLTNRKVGSLAFRHLALNARQGGANQTAMHRAFPVVGHAVLERFRIGVGGSRGEGA